MLEEGAGGEKLKGDREEIEDQEYSELDPTCVRGWMRENVCARTYCGGGKEIVGGQGYCARR